MKKLLLFIVYLLLFIPNSGISQISPLSKNLQVQPKEKNEIVKLMNKKLYEEGDGQAPVEIAWNFIKKHWEEFGLKGRMEANINYRITTRLFDRNIVRFEQIFKGLKVGKCEISVEVGDDGRIYKVRDSTVPISPAFKTISKISNEQALDKSLGHLKSLGNFDKKKSGLTVQIVGSRPLLAYEVVVEGRNPLKGWRTIVNANTGELILAENIAMHFDAPAKVFSPSPTVSAKKRYGETNYIDNDDATNSTLNKELMDVTLEGLTQGGDGKYYLIGPNAQIIENDPPSSAEYEGLFEQTNLNDFIFDRSDRGFEAAMCYYYIDQAVKNLNDGLGVGYSPIGYTGGLKFDPHIQNFQNAAFWQETEELYFGDGDGDVDSGEDAFIIFHELGHSLHYSMTGGNPSQEHGVSEGLSDYWAQSFSKGCGITGVWHEWEDEYHAAFSWGLMPYAEESNNLRFTNFEGDYNPINPNLPDDHITGQHISTALMRIFSDLGKDKTDQIVLMATQDIKGGPLSQFGDEATDLREAGGIIYEAAVELGCTENELCIVYKHLDDKLKISTLPNPPTPPSGGSLDVYMKDGPCDNGIEPNNITPHMYKSQDIWVRWEQDGDLAHQNPEYKLSGDNYVYVRIRGRGCDDDSGDATLRVFFSKASTNLYWPSRWINYEIAGTSGPVVAGDEITSAPIPIPDIEAGDEWIVAIPWEVPNPDDFLTDVHHFCLLARIESTNDPIRFTETVITGDNLRKNNNLTARNVSIFDEIVGNEPNAGPISVFIGCGSSLTNGGIKVEPAAHPLGKSIFDYGNVYLELLGALHTDWTGKGQPGSSYQVMQDGKILVLDNNFHLDSLNLSNCENEVINVYFEPFADAGECAFDVVQYNELDSVAVQGRERFEYYPAPAGDQGERFAGEAIGKLRKSDNILLYPNPAGASISILMPNGLGWEGMNYQLCDLQGARLYATGLQGPLTGKTSVVSLTNLSSGIYLINLTDAKGKLVESLKFVKQ